jgi:hypothetical protein
MNRKLKKRQFPTQEKARILVFSLVGLVVDKKSKTSFIISYPLVF